jgi:hypothetical protein
MITHQYVKEDTSSHELVKKYKKCTVPKQNLLSKKLFLLKNELAADCCPAAQRRKSMKNRYTCRQI